MNNDKATQRRQNKRTRKRPDGTTRLRIEKAGGLNGWALEENLSSNEKVAWVACAVGRWNNSPCGQVAVAVAVAVARTHRLSTLSLLMLVLSVFCVRYGPIGGAMEESRVKEESRKRTEWQEGGPGTLFSTR